MSTFKAKASYIKAKLEQENAQKENISHCSSQKQIRIVRPPIENQNQKITIQEPIIIEKRTTVNKLESSRRVSKNPQSSIQIGQKKTVESFVPANIPTRDKNYPELINQKLNQGSKKCQNQEIEIQIEKDDSKSKECLKKLFKKIHKLTEELKESESQRIRLKLELQNYEDINRKTSDFDRKVGALEKDKYKLEIEVDMLRKLLKDRDSEIERHKAIVPKEIIKEVIVEKPVEVIVEVPRPVPGPERVVEKVVEIPKYVDVEKKVPVEVIKEVPKEVIKTVEVPVVTEKVVYVDKPVYIDREVPVHVDREIPVEVPIEKPVYIDRPYVEEELLERMRRLEDEVQNLLRINAELDTENRHLAMTCDQLSENIQILRRHNEEKNREVEHLLHNSIDYNPCSPSQQEFSVLSNKYTVSSKNHKRAI